MDLIPIPGAELYYDPPFLQPEEATLLFNTLLSKCAWTRHKASFGHTVPRDEAYYGDPGTHYTYSRREYKPLPWIPELSLKARASKKPPRSRPMPICPCQERATTQCSAIFIEMENDSVGLHADVEPEMGPVIASVSLGSERLFRLKRKDGSVAFSERLLHGRLLIMAGRTQQNFKREVPKEPGVTLSWLRVKWRSGVLR